MNRCPAERNPEQLAGLFAHDCDGERRDHFDGLGLACFNMLPVSPRTLSRLMRALGGF
jgi:hypothetical protein